MPATTQLPEYQLPAPATKAGVAIYERAVDLIGDRWARAYAEEVRVMALAIEAEAAAIERAAIRAAVEKYGGIESPDILDIIDAREP